MSHYYGARREQTRLTRGASMVEFMRTQELILRHLPAPPAVVYDIVNLYAIEGPLWLSQAALERWADPALRERYLEAVGWIERDRALMAASGHLLVVGTKAPE